MPMNGCLVMKPASALAQNELVVLPPEQVVHLDEVDEVDEYLLNLVPGNVI